MPSISINSLIANLPWGRTVSSGPSTPPSAPVPAVQEGVVFTKGEPWRNRADTSYRVGYTRQDAMGGPPAEVSAINQGPPPLGSTAEVRAEQDPNQGDVAEVQQTPADSVKKPNGDPLSKAEMAMLRELQKADTAVKAHEMAHLAAAGGYAKGGASFSYQQGPDGQSYAVAGEVQVDTGREKTPEATIRKMQIVRQAALAPTDPSPQDQRVAAYATLQIAESSRELDLARAADSKPLAPQDAQSDEEEGTPRSIYQEAGQGLGQNPSPEGTTKSPRAFAAYRTPLPPAAQTDRQGGLDQIA